MRLLGFEIFGMDDKRLKMGLLLIFNELSKSYIVKINAIGFSHSLPTIKKKHRK